MTEKGQLTNEELSRVSGGWGEEKTGGPENWEDSEGTTSTGIVTGEYLLR